VGRMRDKADLSTKNEAELNFFNASMKIQRERCNVFRTMRDLSSINAIARHSS